MIRVKKPVQAPAILRNRGTVETQRLRDLYDASPAEYNEGSKTFDFDSSLYAAKSVKNALRKAQHEKCCFCESKVSHVAYGDVEHFRPKAGFRQGAEDQLGRPGYYWLAYEWSNLLFCCSICNQQFKKNLFPLADPNSRAISHHDNIDDEQPVFLNPGIDDPDVFLDFREEYLFAINGNDRGGITVEALGLNREELVEVRRDALAKLKLLIESREKIAQWVVNDPQPDLVAHLADLDAEIESCVQDSAQYAAMARAALRSLRARS